VMWRARERICLTCNKFFSTTCIWNDFGGTKWDGELATGFLKWLRWSVRHVHG